MAYFDSPKNKAMWRRELDQLKQQREARKNATPDEIAALRGGRQTESAEVENNPLRERVSYQQLVNEEQAKTALKHSEHERTATLSSSKQMQKKQGEPTL